MNLAQKIKILESYTQIKKEAPPPKKKVEDEHDAPKPPPVVEVKDYFTNQDVYKTICENEKLEKPQDKFIGCNRCPKYLGAQNKDFFSLLSYASGAVIKKDETESVFFMYGCMEDENNIALILRKGFGGWQRVSQFKGVAFDGFPLSFTDKQGFLILLGKIKKIDKNDVEKEILFSLNFKNNKVHSSDIFSLHSTNSIKCQSSFIANMGSPSLTSKHAFSIPIDVLGWQDDLNSDCKISSRKSRVHLKPSSYTLNFTQKESVFIGDRKTQQIMTELEKAQE
ncbi:MAG: hypothetical protein V4591_04240 [Bdellovibrionota bacterium]